MNDSDPVIDDSSLAELDIPDAAFEPPPPPGLMAKAAAGGKAEPQAAPEPLTNRASEMIDAAIAVASPRPKGRAFNAELDVAEIDNRGRPGPTWVAKGRLLSRSNLVVESRRMCYVGREIVVAVHLIDDEPVPLFGRVHSCVYEGDGVHLVDLDLAEVPRDEQVQAWLRTQSRN